MLASQNYFKADVTREVRDLGPTGLRPALAQICGPRRAVAHMDLQLRPWVCGCSFLTSEPFQHNKEAQNALQKH